MAREEPGPKSLGARPFLQSGTGAGRKWIDAQARGAGALYDFGVEFSREAVRQIWKRAIADGLVSGSVEAFFLQDEARALTSEAKRFVDRIRRPLAFLQETFDESLVETFASITRAAAAGAWTKERYVDAIELAAAAAGAEHFRRSWAATWFESAILAPAYAHAVVEKFGRQPTARLFPYLAVTTMRDEKVRPNHRHMDRFVAASTWSGWARAAPPYGWNCRCRLFPVSYVIAHASGFSGAFGGHSSAAKYATWSGPDQGFPKMAFAA